MKPKTIADKRNRLSIGVLTAGLAVNLALAIMKLYVGLSTNSVSVLLDSTNSFLDIFGSAVGIAAFLLVARGGSGDLTYGSGRSEYIAGFLLSALALGQSFLFFYKSAVRLTMPTPIWFGAKHCVIILVALAVKIAMTFMYRAANAEIQSATVRALEYDSALDIGITAASVVAFSIAGRVDYAVDAWFGIVISVAVFVFGVRLVAANLKNLLGKNADERQTAAIKAVVDDCGYDASVTKITLHDYGYNAVLGDVFVELSVEGLAEAEEICGNIENVLFDKTAMRLTVVPVCKKTYEKEK